MDGISKRLTLQPIDDKGDEKDNGYDTQKNKKDGVMIVIEFSNPLSSGVERIIFSGCFERSFPFFWIIRGVDSREKEKKPWAKVKKVDKDCSDDDKFIRKIKEYGDHVGKKGVENSSNDC